jgi:hypothetical protein
MRFILYLLTRTTHTKESFHVPKLLPTLWVCTLSLKRLTLRHVETGSNANVLANEEGHAHWDQKTLQKEIDILPTCYLCPVGSIPQHLALHTVCNLCLKSSVSSWKEMEVPCRTASTNESQRRNPWKASKTSSPAGGVMWMYAFSILLNACLTLDSSMRHVCACWSSWCTTSMKPPIYRIGLHKFKAVKPRPRTQSEPWICKVKGDGGLSCWGAIWVQNVQNEKFN